MSVCVCVAYFPLLRLSAPHRMHIVACLTKFSLCTHCCTHMLTHTHTHSRSLMPGLLLIRTATRHIFFLHNSDRHIYLRACVSAWHIPKCISSGTKNAECSRVRCTQSHYVRARTSVCVLRLSGCAPRLVHFIQLSEHDLHGLARRRAAADT